MRTVEQGGRGKRVQLTRFAGLGALTGAIAAGVLIAIDFNWASLYVLPGLVFGLAFGTLLHRQRLLRPGRAALYAAAATLANAAAVVAAMQSLDTVETIVGSGGTPALALSGGIAGAVGGGLLAAAAAPPLRIGQWPRLAAAGALLGALLPILIEGQEISIFAFYMIWQAGYAAALAATLPRREAI